MLYKWDKNINFKKTYFNLILKTKEFIKKEKYKQAIYTLILLTQLRNGCRLSESIEAVKKFLKENNFETNVRVRKRKGYERLIIFPEQLRDFFNIFKKYSKFLFLKKEKKLKETISHFCRNNFGFNTHSLRYSFITYQSLEKGLSPQVVAKMTGHAKLDFIAYYIQSKEAEKILRKEVF